MDRTRGATFPRKYLAGIHIHAKGFSLHKAIWLLDTRNSTGSNFSTKVNSPSKIALESSWSRKNSSRDIIMRLNGGEGQVALIHHTSMGTQFTLRIIQLSGLKLSEWLSQHFTSLLWVHSPGKEITLYGLAVHLLQYG